MRIQHRQLVANTIKSAVRVGWRPQKPRIGFSLNLILGEIGLLQWKVAVARILRTFPWSFGFTTKISKLLADLISISICAVVVVVLGLVLILVGDGHPILDGLVLVE